MTSFPSGDELRLTISPHGHIEWCGPRATLEASGLIPANFKWPKGIDYADWSANGFNFLLRRCRPDGLMGPMRRWMKCDYWFMRRCIPCHPDDMWRIYEPYRDLGDILFQLTRVGAASITFSKVHADKRIQKFEARLVPQAQQRPT